MRVKNREFNLLWIPVVIIVLALGVFSVYESVSAANQADETASKTDIKLALQLVGICQDLNKAAKRVDAKINAIIATSGGGTSLQQPQVDMITDPTVRAIFQRVIDVGSLSRDALKQAAGKPLPQKDCTKIGTK